MATVFTKILRGELPARFVYQDEHCAAFLTIQPLRPGHTLVVPRLEIDHWIDVPQVLAQHVMSVAQQVGHALKQAFPCTKIGLTIVGLEVPHVHIHLVPIDHAEDLSFARAQRHPSPTELDDNAHKIRTALGMRA